MTGRIIDKAALSLIGTTAAYLLFLNAGFGIPVSALLAFACACLARTAIRLRPRRHAASAAEAKAALVAILAMDDSSAETALRALVRPEAGARFVPLLRHPEDRLSLAGVYRLWREHRGDDRVIVAVTCPVYDRAQQLSRTLAAPAMTLLDRRALLRRIRQTGLYVPVAQRRPALRGIGKRLAQLIRRPAPPKAPMTGIALLLIYLSTGRTLCLWLSMLVLFRAGASWIHALT